MNYATKRIQTEKLFAYADRIQSITRSLRFLSEEENRRRPNGSK